jgi:hypothetical protein
MRSWFRLILVGAALVGAGGCGDKGPAQKPAAVAPKDLPPIEGAQMQVEGLVYNVTDVRILEYGKPSDAPYLTNLERPAEGSAYLGVFLRVYNPTGKDLPSAPGYLLEPSKQPGLAEQNSASESPYDLAMGATVKAKNVLPEPGSAAAKGEIPGALLLYPISKETTDSQPFDLVVHTAKGAIAKLRLPHVPKLTAAGKHG